MTQICNAKLVKNEIDFSQHLFHVEVTKKYTMF